MSTDDQVVRDLQRQVRALRRKTVFPREIAWPPGRKVFAAVMTKSIGRSYAAGELLLPLQVYLDAPPDWCGLDPEAPAGSTVEASGTTGIRRVR